MEKTSPSGEISAIIDDVFTMTLAVVCVDETFHLRTDRIRSQVVYVFLPLSEPLKLIRSPDSRLSLEKTRKQNGIKKVLQNN